MNKQKFIFGSFAAATVLMAGHFFGADSVDTNPDLVNRNVSLNNNTPAYISGCQTYHRPVATGLPVYPAVRKNFVTRLCALEVFPTNGIIAGRNMKLDAKWMPLR